MTEQLTKDVGRPHREAVDRLIELASYGKPTEQEIDETIEQTHHSLLHEEPQKLAPRPMWKTLGQLKTLLPIAAKLLPLLEIGGVRLHAPTSVSIPKELTDGVAEVQSSHRELRRIVQEQTVELKRLDEQLTRIRATTEKNVREHLGLVEDVKSIRTLALTISGILGVLLIALIVMVGLLLSHQAH